MAEGESTNAALVLAKKQGIEALEPKVEEIGETNWGSLTAALEAVIQSLEGRGITELVQSLRQIESLTARLIADIGVVAEAKNLEPVHPLTVGIAWLFQHTLPALKNILRRHELRSHGEKEHERLGAVNKQLVELRQAVNQKINELLEQTLLQESEDFQKLAEEVSSLQGQLGEILAVRQNPLLTAEKPSDDEFLSRKEYQLKTRILTHYYHAPMYGQPGHLSEYDDAPVVRQLFVLYGRLSNEDAAVLLQNAQEKPQKYGGAIHTDVSVLINRFKALESKVRQQIDITEKRKAAMIGRYKQRLVLSEE